MTLTQFNIWIADLNPKLGTEPGKIRPVVIVQTNLLNEVGHPSTIICPLTTNVKNNAYPLRIRVQKKVAGVKKDSDIMIDQMRAIDNQRLIKNLGVLPKNISSQIQESIKIVFDFFD